jgi:hypothetical protein
MWSRGFAATALAVLAATHCAEAFTLNGKFSVQLFAWMEYKTRNETERRVRQSWSWRGIAFLSGGGTMSEFYPVTSIRTLLRSFAVVAKTRRNLSARSFNENYSSTSTNLQCDGRFGLSRDRCSLCDESVYLEKNGYTTSRKMTTLACSIDCYQSHPDPMSTFDVSVLI